MSSSPRPRLIIHGGAGNITRKNLSPHAWEVYSSALLAIHRSTSALLSKGATALDAATHAVALFEDSPLWNCGKGAVFTRDGTIELEASVSKTLFNPLRLGKRQTDSIYTSRRWTLNDSGQVMVTRDFHKRACAVVLVNKVKNPIKLAREMLVRGQKDGSGDGDLSGGAGGAQGHCCLGGETVEKLAKEWGLNMVDESYFWTKRRWDEHERGLHQSKDQRTLRQNVDAWPYSVNSYSRWPLFTEQDSGWDGQAYLPQGTVGCVALDQYGEMCVATSTGGLTNKLSGRIGDTPTIGAGFWAEEWNQSSLEKRTRQPQDLSLWIPAALNGFADGLRNVMGDCIPKFSGYQETPCFQDLRSNKVERMSSIRAVAMSGTGNGDSFLRLAAARTAGAIVRFSPTRSLESALHQIAGSGGELERSAGDRWGMTGEGEGGIIGIELVDGKGKIAFDFNCGGMFRCWVDDHGKEKVMVFKDEY